MAGDREEEVSLATDDFQGGAGIIGLAAEITKNLRRFVKNPVLRGALGPIDLAITVGESVALGVSEGSRDAALAKSLERQKRPLLGGQALAAQGDPAGVLYVAGSKGQELLAAPGGSGLSLRRAQQANYLARRSAFRAELGLDEATVSRMTAVQKTALRRLEQANVPVKRNMGPGPDFPE